MRKWVINNLDKEFTSSLFTTIYELMYKSIEVININLFMAQSILIIAV